MYIAALPELFGPDGAVLLLIFLVLLGAQKLRALGQAMSEFWRGKDE